jgi:hypothetical protein
MAGIGREGGIDLVEERKSVKKRPLKTEGERVQTESETYSEGTNSVDCQLIGLGVPHDGSEYLRSIPELRSSVQCQC